MTCAFCLRVCDSFKQYRMFANVRRLVQKTPVLSSLLRDDLFGFENDPTVEGMRQKSFGPSDLVDCRMSSSRWGGWAEGWIDDSDSMRQCEYYRDVVM